MCFLLEVLQNKNTGSTWLQLMKFFFFLFCPCFSGEIPKNNPSNLEPGSVNSALARLQRNCFATPTRETCSSSLPLSLDFFIYKTTFPSMTLSFRLMALLFLCSLKTNLWFSWKLWAPNLLIFWRFKVCSVFLSVYFVDFYSLLFFFYSIIFLAPVYREIDQL